MSVIMKVGLNGRMTNKVAGTRNRRSLGIPQGVGYSVMVPKDLLNSPAWLAMSHLARKLVDAIMAEHAAHGGLEKAYARRRR
jgi:hypothetical protein